MGDLISKQLQLEHNPMGRPRAVEMPLSAEAQADKVEKLLRKNLADSLAEEGLSPYQVALKKGLVSRTEQAPAGSDMEKVAFDRLYSRALVGISRAGYNPADIAEVLAAQDMGLEAPSPKKRTILERAAEQSRRRVPKRMETQEQQRTAEREWVEAEEAKRRGQLQLSSTEPEADTADEEIAAGMRKMAPKYKGPKTSEPGYYDQIGADPIGARGWEKYVKVPSKRREFLRGLAKPLTLGLSEAVTKGMEKVTPAPFDSEGNRVSSLDPNWTETGASDRAAQPGTRETGELVGMLLPVGGTAALVKQGSRLPGILNQLFGGGAGPVAKVGAGLLSGVGAGAGLGTAQALSDSSIRDIPRLAAKGASDPFNILLGGGGALLGEAGQAGSAALRNPRRSSGRLIQAVENAGGKASPIPFHPVSAPKGSLLADPLVTGAPSGKEGTWNVARKLGTTALEQRNAKHSALGQELGEEMNRVMESPAQAEKAAAARAANAEYNEASADYLKRRRSGEPPADLDQKVRYGFASEAKQQLTDAEKAFSAAEREYGRLSKNYEGVPPASNYPTDARLAYEKMENARAALDHAQSRFEQWAGEGMPAKPPRVPEATQQSWERLQAAEAARGPAVENMTKVSRDLHGALDEAMAKNISTTGVVLDDDLQRALTKAKQILGAKQDQAGKWIAPEQVDFGDVQAVRKLFQDRANFGTTVPTRDDLVNRDAYSIVNRALRALDPAVEPAQQKYVEGLRKLERANELTTGKAVGKLPDTEETVDKLAGSYMRYGDETMAGVKAGPHLEELREISPDEKKLVDTMAALKARQGLKIIGGDHSLPIEHIAHPKLHALKELGGVLGARVADPLMQLLDKLGSSPLVREQAIRVKDPLTRAAEDKRRRDQAAAGILAPVGGH